MTTQVVQRCVAEGCTIHLVNALACTDHLFRLGSERVAELAAARSNRAVRA